MDFSRNPASELGIPTIANKTYVERGKRYVKSLLIKDWGSDKRKLDPGPEERIKDYPNPPGAERNAELA